MAGINKQFWENRIVTNAEILADKPVIAGTRVSVELILDSWLPVGAWQNLLKIIRMYHGKMYWRRWGLLRMLFGKNRLLWLMILGKENSFDIRA